MVLFLSLFLSLLIYFSLIPFFRFLFVYPIFPSFFSLCDPSSFSLASSYSCIFWPLFVFMSPLSLLLCILNLLSYFLLHLLLLPIIPSSSCSYFYLISCFPSFLLLLLHLLCLSSSSYSFLSLLWPLFSFITLLISSVQTGKNTVWNSLLSFHTDPCSRNKQENQIYRILVNPLGHSLWS
jgi:hypothetical protein